MISRLQSETITIDVLPTELFFHIITFLEPRDVARLLVISKRFFKLARDNELWRTLCFGDSYSEAAGRRREFQAGIPYPTPDPNVLEIRRRAGELSITRGDNGASDSPVIQEQEVSEGSRGNRIMTRARAMANWDPSYSGEQVDWYSEYIARHGPVSLSWLQQPRIEDSRSAGARETKGLGLHHDSNGSRIFAPLDDGSVCLWDLGDAGKINESQSPRRGAIIARSRPGLLTINGIENSPGSDPSLSKQKMTSTGVVECVSVDNFRNKAYVAVQSGLNETDLNTLQISRHERFPFSISALSEASFPTPMTVGTTLSLHLYDPRRSSNSCWSENSCNDRVDTVAKFPAAPHLRGDFYRLLSGDFSEYAFLFQPGPLAIHHFSPPGGCKSGAGEIYVAGRFPSLLVYDRRYFPKLRKTIHSGARLCSLASLPYLWESREDSNMRRNQISLDDTEQPKSLTGSTLVACGEYNGKGSLEMYGLPPEGSKTPGQVTQESTYKNRVSASRTKLLSVATHGTRIVVSDGDGQIRWMERDGSSLVRRWNINEHQPAEVSGLFNSSILEMGSGDVARKLLPINASADGYHDGRDELLVWTGERIGVIAFKNKPQFEEEDWEESLSVEEKAKRKEEKMYSQTMRRALERQADEVRFVRGFGAGT